jgi:hypothetical protein
MNTVSNVATTHHLANVVSELATVAPLHRMVGAEALFVAELQAQLLLERAMVLEAPVPGALLENIPGVEVLWESDPRLVVGVDLNERLRLIVIGADADTAERERFTFAYGLKHVLDVPSRRRSYGTRVGRVRPDETSAYRFATRCSCRKPGCNKHGRSTEDANASSPIISPSNRSMSSLDLINLASTDQCTQSRLSCLRKS